MKSVTMPPMIGVVFILVDGQEPQSVFSESMRTLEQCLRQRAQANRKAARRGLPKNTSYSLAPDGRWVRSSTRASARSTKARST